jgi:hypothetical protein
MKAVYKADDRDEFVTASLIPANRTRASKFGLLDAVIILALLLGTAAVVRLALAE